MRKEIYGDIINYEKPVKIAQIQKLKVKTVTAGMIR